MIVCDAWNAADWLLKKDVKAALADIIPLPSTGMLFRPHHCIDKPAWPGLLMYGSAMGVTGSLPDYR